MDAPPQSPLLFPLILFIPSIAFTTLIFFSFLLKKIDIQLLSQYICLKKKGILLSRMVQGKGGGQEPKDEVLFLGNRYFSIYEGGEIKFISKG
jgi:hypothetical protein